jgi:hypothetical protein
MPPSVRRVSWRGFLAIAGALLLPLPLFVLLGGALHPSLPGAPPGDRRISPVLDHEQRMRLSSYHRDCASSQACEPPLGCVDDARVLMHYCTDSQCATDAQCPVDHACRNIATAGDGPLVRFCVPTGRRQEGEHCVALPSAKDEACASGLLCGGRDGWCARPCQRGDPAACPAGFFCADTQPEPLCLPTCEARGCSSGQECIRYDDRSSECARVYGPHCTQFPCPRGGECQVVHPTDHLGKVWMECIEKCGEDSLPCSEGLTCDGWLCRTPCHPQDPHPCMEGFVCQQLSSDKPYTCQPDW